MNKIKLSPAQSRLLNQLKTDGPTRVWINYPPAVKLVQFGLAYWRGNELVLTPKGNQQ